MSTEDYHQPDRREHPVTQTLVTKGPIIPPPIPAPTPNVLATLRTITVFDSNGQPYEADLVPGDEHRAALAAKDAEIEAFKANNRYMRGHTAGYEEARSKFEPRLRTEEVLHKAARARAEKAEAELAEARQIIRDHDAFSLARAQERDALRAEVERLKAMTQTPAGWTERGEWKPECNSLYVYDAEGKLIGSNHPIAAVAEEYRLRYERIQLRAQLAAAQQDKERLIDALNDATTSLCTLAQQSGRTEELRELSQIRGYAFSRYSAAIDAGRKAQS